MATTRIVVLTAVIVVGGLALHGTRARQAGITRIDLQRYDLSIPGRELVERSS